jgi:23S rRNA pseudouridine1911/1915/1917 synthase
VPPLAILFEDNHILAVNKPAGLLTMGDRTGSPTLLERAKAYLKDKYHKPGDVFLGVVHRLDRPVSGVVLFARTSKAAARLSAQFRDHTIQKCYLAWVDGRVAQADGTLIHWLKKDRLTNHVTVVAANTAGAQECVLDFRRLKTTGNRTLLEISPQTGRSHQIRVQLAAQGWPILGDAKYGSKSQWPNGIALHASSITFDHPTKHELVSLDAPLPDTWPDPPVSPGRGAGL